MLKMLRKMVFYFQNAYTLVNIPFSFIGFTSSIYYLAVKNIDWLYNYFPTYEVFLKISVLFAFIMMLIGYINVKIGLYQETIEQSQENNPYLNYKIARVQIPMYEAHIQFYDMMGIDTSRMKKILEVSRYDE